MSGVSRGKSTPGSTPGSFHAASGPRSRVEPPVVSDDVNACAWCGAPTVAGDAGVRTHEGGVAECATGGAGMSAMVVPEGMVLEVDGRGSWTALHRGVWSGSYGGRAQAVAGWYRQHARVQRDMDIAAAMNRITEAIGRMSGEFGDIRLGYIGNVSPNGAQDSRQWSVSAPGWSDPKAISTSNPIMVHIGTTDDVLAVDEDAAKLLVARMDEKLRTGVSSGRFQPRHYTRY